MFTEKVTTNVYKQRCGGQLTITRTVTQCSSSSFSSSNFQNIENNKSQSIQNLCRTNTTSSSASACPSPMSLARAPKMTNGCPTTKATPPQSSSSSSSSCFEQAVLEAHNKLRAEHSAPPLKLNPAISQYAQEWADNLAARNTMQHRSNNKYGENLYACYGKTNVEGADAVQSWYDEIKHYRFGQPSPGNFSQVGHFTQVVWKESRELGVGIAKNGNSVYVVCNYDPPGNFMGKYASNVTSS